MSNETSGDSGVSLCSHDEVADKVARLCRDATFHAIRGLNEINNQSQRLWSEFDTTDCEYHLQAAIGYLRQLREAKA